MNLNQVTLPVVDMDAATEFYRRMGFLQIVDTPHYARFECPQGNSTFSLSLDDGTDQNSNNGMVGDRAHRQFFSKKSRNVLTWASAVCVSGFIAILLGWAVLFGLQSPAKGAAN